MPKHNSSFAAVERKRDTDIVALPGCFSLHERIAFAELVYICLSHKIGGPWKGIITAFMAQVHDVIISLHFLIVNGMRAKLISQSAGLISKPKDFRLTKVKLCVCVCYGVLRL
jgi:hypothetical protein